MSYGGFVLFGVAAALVGRRLDGTVVRATREPFGGSRVISDEIVASVTLKRRQEQSAAPGDWC